MIVEKAVILLKNRQYIIQITGFIRCMGKEDVVVYGGKCNGLVRAHKSVIMQH